MITKPSFIGSINKNHSLYQFLNRRGIWKEMTEEWGGLHEGVPHIFQQAIYEDTAVGVAGVPVGDWNNVSWIQFPDPPFRFAHAPLDKLKITQVFANNPEYYLQFGYNGHEGVDLRALTPVNTYAVADGEVIVVQESPDIEISGNYGKHVYVRHDYGYTSVYAHLSRVDVRLGEIVDAGDILGLTGDTGRVFGAHLHLGLKKEGATRNGETIMIRDFIDPTPFLFPKN